jgi:hypothetical protein
MAERHYTNLNKKLDNLMKKHSENTTTPRYDDKHRFYTRIKNFRNINLIKEETQLIKYGLNYSIEKPTSTYFASLIAETERAIRLLSTSMQGTYRFLATNKLKQIINSSNQANVMQKRQLYVLTKLNQKFKTENAIITQSDKGKTIVIIDSKEYSSKVHSFITATNFNTLNKDPTNKFQTSIQKIVKESNLVIDKRQRKFLIQKKPSAPILKAQLKLHKMDIPIRPVINNRTAPAYKLSKYITKILQHINLNNQYNLNNPINLANDLINIPAQNNYRITFDIKDLYVNIRIDETINIMKTKLQQNNNTRITNQIISLIRTVLLQHYFTFQQKIYQPEKGIST